MRNEFTTVAACLLAMLLTGCSRGPDYTPLRDGMVAIGICWVVFAVVNALCALVINESSDSKSQQRKRRGGNADDEQEGR